MRAESASLAMRLPAAAQLRWQQRRLLDHFARLRRGRLRLHFGGPRSVELQGVDPGPAAEIRIHRPGALLWRLFWRGDIGFGEAYVAGDWSTDKPARLLELLALNLDAYAQSESRHRLIQMLVGLQHRLRRNSRPGSRRNIAAHYDLGNDFYARWLDSSMTYSAGIFGPEGSLDDAQIRKYERILALIDPAPGARILEIGCGWGGFAEYAARRGLQVTGLTLSKQQLAFARRRMVRAGLSTRVDLRLCDYRDFRGQVDHVVSIEMFEAVGQAYWQGYFDTLAHCLKPGGRAALQVITIDEHHFERYAANPGGFIQTYIFPGGMLPTRTHLETLGRDAGLRPGGMQAYGPDYAETLARWRVAFNACRDWMERHGYDRRFRRMWRYYLAFCEAGFRARQIDVVQCVFEKD